MTYVETCNKIRTVHFIDISGVLHRITAYATASDGASTVVYPHIFASKLNSVFLSIREKCAEVIRICIKCVFLAVYMTEADGVDNKSVDTHDGA